MKNTLDELITESKEAFNEIQNKVELSTSNFSDDATAFWSDLKADYADVHEKLELASRDYTDNAKKDAYLSMMEAKHKLLDLQDITERFTADVLDDAKEDLDIIKYKAELLSLKAESKWDVIKEEVAEVYESSKEDVQKLASAASDEVKSMFAKLKTLV